MPNGMDVVQLAPAVELVTIRLFITTKSLTGANAQSGYPDLYWCTNQGGFYKPMATVKRQQGGTDLFEQTFLPQPLRFDNFVQARTAFFQIRTHDSEVWEIDQITMTGRFTQFGPSLAPRARGNPRVVWKSVDLGWRLMAYHDDIVMDPARGVFGHLYSIMLNGTF